MESAYSFIMNFGRKKSFHKDNIKCNIKQILSMHIYKLSLHIYHFTLTFSELYTVIRLIKKDGRRTSSLHEGVLKFELVVPLSSWFVFVLGFGLRLFNVFSWFLTVLKMSANLRVTN